jgi:hypothetical protein
MDRVFFVMVDRVGDFRGAMHCVSTAIGIIAAIESLTTITMAPNGPCFFVMVDRFGVAPTQCNTFQINDKRVHIVSR